MTQATDNTMDDIEELKSIAIAIRRCEAALKYNDSPRFSGGARKRIKTLRRQQRAILTAMKALN